MTIDRSIRPRTSPVIGLRPGPVLGPGDEWNYAPQLGAAELGALLKSKTGTERIPDFAWDLGVGEDPGLPGGQPTIPPIAGPHYLNQNAVGAVQYQRATPYAGQKACGHADGDANHLYVASNDFDFPDVDFIIGAWWRSGTLATTRGICGRGIASPTVNHYSLYQDTVAVRWATRVDAVTKSTTVLGKTSNREQLAVCGVSRTLDLGFLVTRDGFHTVDLTGFALLDTAGGTFRVHHSFNAFGGEQDALRLWVWRDANALISSIDDVRAIHEVLSERCLDA